MPPLDLRERARELRARHGAPNDARLARDRATLIGRLERAPDGGREARDLARRLRTCRVGARCGSAACDICRIRHQVRALARLERRWPPGTALVMGTMLIRNWERSAGQLHTLELASIKQRFQQLLRDAGCFLIPIWAYIDISWNTHTGGEYAPHWCPHIHFIAEAIYRPELRSLRKHLVAGTSIKRPVRVDDVKDWAMQASYACKPRPVHRLDFDKENPRAKLPKRWLPREPAVEFALWIGGREPRDRHFRCGMEAQLNSLKH